MGVDLGRRDIHVAEHHLDRSKISPSFQKMTGEGVTQKVGGDPLKKTGPAGIILQALPELLSAHPFSRSVDKKDWTLLAF